MKLKIKVYGHNKIKKRTIETGTGKLVLSILNALCLKEVNKITIEKVNHERIIQ